MKNRIKLNSKGIRQVIEKRYTSPAAINNVEDAVELIINNFHDLDREAFFSINIDKNGKPINFSINHVGSLDRSVAHPREIFKTAILSGAEKIVLMHNHPSGGSRASQSDIDTTEALTEGAEVLGLEVLDHYVFTPQKQYLSVFDEAIKTINKEVQLELNFVSEDTYSLDDVRIRQIITPGGEGYEILSPLDIKNVVEKVNGHVEVDEILAINLNKQLQTDSLSRIVSINRKTMAEISKTVLENSILNNSVSIIPVIRFSEDEEEYENQLNLIDGLIHNGNSLGIHVMDVFVYGKNESFTLRERIWESDYYNRFGDYFVQEGEDEMKRKKYKVKITETLEREIEVEAASEEEAIYNVKQLYYDEEIILDYNDFDGDPEISVIDSHDQTMDLNFPESINFGYTTHPTLEFDLQAVLDVHNQQVVYTADQKEFLRTDFEEFGITTSTIQDIFNDPNNEIEYVSELLDLIISDMSVEFENLVVLEDEKGDGLVYQNEGLAWFSHGVYDLSDKNLESYYFDEMENNPGHVFTSKEFEEHFMNSYIEVNHEKYVNLVDQYVEATRLNYPDMILSKNNDNKTYNLYSEYNSDDENEMWLSAPEFVSYHKEKIAEVFKWEDYTDELEMLKTTPTIDYNTTTKSNTVDHEFEVQEEMQDKYSTKPKQLKLNRSQEKIIEFVKESLNKGVVPWHQPWTSSKPFNAVSGTEYKGHNQVVLSIVSGVKGYSDPRWVTFNQAKEAGWKIKRGSKATQLYYPLLYNTEMKRFITAEDFKGLDEEGVKKLKEESTLRLKYFNVFNADDILGIPKLEKSEMDTPQFSNDIAGDISKNIQNEMGLEIVHGGERAFYNPTQDNIAMPDKLTFESEMAYYDTLMHEMAHATGHSKRLNRDLSGSFGSVSYAEEELVAEFTSMFLSQDLGFEKQAKELENNAAYIASWNQVLDEDPSLFVRAINNSNNAYHYLYDAGKIGEYEQDLSGAIEDEFKPLAHALSGKYIAIEGRSEDKKELIDFLSSKLKVKVIEHGFGAKEIEKIKDTSVTDFDLEKTIFDTRRDLLNDIKAKNGDHIVISDFDIRRSYVYAADPLIEEGSYNVFRNYLDNSIEDKHIPDLTIIVRSENDMSEKFDKFETFYEDSKGAILRINKEDIDLDLMDPITNKILSMVPNRKSAYKKGGNKVVDLEQLKQEVLITDYAEIALGLKLNPKRNGLVSTYEHDSLMIYTQKNDFVRFSQPGVGGNIFNFVMHFENVDFAEAVEKVKKFHKEYGVKSQEVAKVETLETLKLPEAASDNKKVISYLTKHRRIPLSIVNDFIDRGLLYQDVRDNCVFVGKLNDKNLYASLRSSKKDGSFKMDVANSISDVGVFVDNGGDVMVLTESVIDNMSLMALHTVTEGIDFLSVNGVTKAKSVFDFHMQKRIVGDKKLDRVVIAFDNDRAGEEATIDLVKHIKTNYPNIAIHHIYPKDVDWNDDLVNLSKKPEDLTRDAPFIYEGGLGY